MAEPPKLKVVIVDDSALVQSQYSRLFEHVPGVTVVGRAQNGAEAIREVKRKTPDLVLMDLVMPDIDGLTALRMLCKGIPGIRVAVVSSLGGSCKAAEEAFRQGAIEVLSKPVRPEMLARLVSQELDRKTRLSGGGR